MKINKENYFDVIIIGSGPAGFSAGLYAKDCNLKVLICAGEQKGGLITTTDNVDNYLGFQNIHGTELANQFEKHVQNKECDMIDENVINIKEIKFKYNDIEYSLYECETSSNISYYAPSVLICSGASPNLLPLKTPHNSPRVYYCATCDGFLCSNQEVCVVGGGNSAIETVIYLSHICSNITLIYRGNELKRPHASLLIKLEELVKSGKVKILYNTIIEEIQHYRRTPTTSEHNNIILNTNQVISNLKTFAVFVCIGHTPNTWFVKNININLRSDNSILTNTFYETNQFRIYAAGDVLGDYYSQYNIERSRQVVSSAAEGTAAILNLNKSYRDYINTVRNIIIFNI